MNLTGALILCDASPDPIRVVSNRRIGQVTYFDKGFQAFRAADISAGYTIIEPPPAAKENPVAVEQVPVDSLQFRPAPPGVTMAHVPALVQKCVTWEGHHPQRPEDVDCLLQHLRYNIAKNVPDCQNVDGFILQWLCDLDSRKAVFELREEHRNKMAANQPPAVPNAISDAPGPQQATPPPPEEKPAAESDEPSAPAPIPTDPEKLACYDRIGGMQCKNLRGLKTRLTRSHKMNWTQYCVQFNLDPTTGGPATAAAPAAVTAPPPQPPAGPGVPPLAAGAQSMPTPPVPTQTVLPMQPPPQPAPAPAQPTTPPVMSFTQQPIATPPPPVQPPATAMPPPPPVQPPAMPAPAYPTPPVGMPPPAMSYTAAAPSTPPAMPFGAPQPVHAAVQAPVFAQPQPAMLQPPAAMPPQAPPLAVAQVSTPAGAPMTRSEAAAAMGGAVILTIVRLEDLKQVDLKGFTDANVLARLAERSALQNLGAEDMADVKGFRKGDQVKERIFHDLLTKYPQVYVIVQNFDWILDPALVRSILARTTKIVMVAKGGLTSDIIDLV